MKYALVVLISLGLSVYQVLLKMGLNKGATRRGNILKYLKIWQFVLANGLMLVIGYFWAYLLQKSDFIRVYPFLALAYMWSMIFAKYVFREAIGISKVSGVLLIIAGIVVSNV